MVSVAPNYTELDRQYATVQSAVAEVQLPAGVHLQEVRLDTDHTGDPAVYVFYRVSKRIPLDKKRISELVQLQDAVTSTLDLLKTGRLPYIRFVD